MTDTEKDYINIKLCRDEASGVYYTQLKRSEEAMRELQLIIESDGEQCSWQTHGKTLLFYRLEDRKRYLDANNLYNSITLFAPVRTVGLPPKTNALSPIGARENYFMPTGYKPIKEERIL